MKNHFSRTGSAKPSSICKSTEDRVWIFELGSQKIKTYQSERPLVLKLSNQNLNWRVQWSEVLPKNWTGEFSGVESFQIKLWTGSRVNRLPCFFMLWRALPFILHLDRFRRRWSLVTRLHCAGTQTRTLRSIQLRYNRPIEAAHGWKFMRPCLCHLTRSTRMTQSETFQCREWVRTCCLCPPHSLPSSGQSDVFWALLPRPWRQSREYALQILLNLLVSTETRTAQHQSYCSRWRCSGQGHSRVNVQEGGWGL